VNCVLGGMLVFVFFFLGGISLFGGRIKTMGGILECGKGHGFLDFLFILGFLLELCSSGGGG